MFKIFCHGVLFLTISWCVSIHCGILHLNKSAVDDEFIKESPAVLDFSSSGLTRLKKKFLKSSLITHLFLTDNNIEEIEEGAFDSLPNLIYLNLTGNSISFDQLNFGNKSKIEVLVLDNAMSYYFESRLRIAFGNPTKLPKLERLYLRNNSIASIDEESLKMLYELQITPNLSHLFLENNQIASVNFVEFLPPTVTHLYLSDNQISKFNSVSLKHLETLEISNNNIKNLCDSNENCDGITLKGAKNLEVLLMSNVQLQNIEPHSFEDQRKLLLLDLSQNEIRAILSQTFDNLANLMVLHLDNNKLESIPDVCSLKNLELLSVAHNRIKIIDNSMSCLSKVKEFNFSGNILDTINSEAFSNFLELEKVDLSENKLVVLPDNWISLKSNLQYLNLHNNLFTSLESMSLTRTENLKFFRIGYNPLETINVKILKSLPENTTVDIEMADECMTAVSPPPTLGSSEHCESCRSYCSNNYNPYTDNPEETTQYYYYG